MKKTLITAHTGNDGTPDNSLLSIETAVSLGADIVEVDVVFSPQGEILLSHDPVENRTSEPSLSQAMELIRKNPGVKMNMDLKTIEEGKVSQIQEMAMEYQIHNRVFFTGVEGEWAALVRKSAPNIPYFINLEPDRNGVEDPEYITALAEAIAENGGLGLNVRYSFATKQLTDGFHAKGLLLYVWTVNDECAMRQMLDYGVDSITTRQVALANEIIHAR